MSTSSRAAAPGRTQLTLQEQAAALWTYVQVTAPRFTLEAALDVVEHIRPSTFETQQSLAKRLRSALQERGISIKHNHALHATSCFSGFGSWHTNSQARAAKLTFTTLDTDSVGEKAFASWSELAVELREWADRLIVRGQLPLRVMSFNFTGKILSISTPVPALPDAPRQHPQSWPLGTVSSVVDDPEWLENAPAALEKLRRHLEESGKAVLDGYAALQFCATSHDVKGMPTAVTTADVTNSELVLMREDNESDPQGGYEIARGDELTCWHQMELSLRDDRTNELDEVQITVPDEGVGAWLVNGIRYVWAIETLKPKEYVPGRVHRGLGISDCERLLRRYRLAKLIHSNGFKHHEQTKHVDYLSGPPENYRVDLHFVLRQLKEAGLTWESYCEQFEAEPLPMQDLLPVGFVFQMLQNLKIEEPNKVFAKPNLSEMARVVDDSLLRALMPRVETVRYVRPRDLEPELADEVRKAVEEFGDGLRMQKFVASGGLAMEQELPYLVYANEAEQLRATAEELGLEMYAAALPHLHSTKGILPELPNSWPWALGNALFLRFERRGGAQ